MASTQSEAGLPPIVSRAEWEVRRAELLVREKELTRMKDAVSAARRRMPMLEITEKDTADYVFDTETGPLSLHAKDTSFALVSRARALLAVRDGMGWDLPWVSSGATAQGMSGCGCTTDTEREQP
jgi:predicted dithiol-disulfide oxidoreductase (DUF899 family)